MAMALGARVYDITALPRASVRVVAEARKTTSNRMTKKNNAVDVKAASLNSTHHVGEESTPEEVKKTTTPEVPLHELLMQRFKLDKALDEVAGFMAPREKGDIRDVILMSLSFAVLVYISQRLVCLYCVLRHMPSNFF